MLMEEAKPGRPADAPGAEGELTGGAEVTFARSGVIARWDSECESILDLAEAQGLNLPYSCRSGICHTCACEMTAGAVEYLGRPHG